LTALEPKLTAVAWRAQKSWSSGAEDRWTFSGTHRALRSFLTAHREFPQFLRPLLSLGKTAAVGWSTTQRRWGHRRCVSELSPLFPLTASPFAYHTGSCVTAAREGHGRDSGCGRFSGHEPARFQRRVAQHRQMSTTASLPLDPTRWASAPLVVPTLVYCGIQQGEPLLLPTLVHGVAAATCPWRKMPGSGGSMTWRYHNPLQCFLIQ